LNFYYCERNSIETFAEPLNALSNVAFVLCGIIFFLRKGMIKNPLPYSVIFIGFSSFLFHYIPTRFYSTLDVFSILLFVVLYNTLLTKNILNYSFFKSALSSIILILMSFLLGILFSKTIISTSSFYLGLLSYMIYIAFLLKKASNIKYFLIAIILFSISLIVRSIDIYLCDLISFGTHFVWHILNSLVIYFLILFLFLTNRSSPKKPS
jgi:hypothetical protein